MLPVRCGSKVPSGHYKLDKILSGKYTVKEISPDAEIWRGRCINLQKEKTQCLRSSPQMQTEVIKILFWGCSYCSDVGTRCCTLLPRGSGVMGAQRAHQCFCASQHSHSSFRGYNSPGPHCNWWAAQCSEFLICPMSSGFLTCFPSWAIPYSASLFCIGVQFILFQNLKSRLSTYSRIDIKIWKITLCKTIGLMHTFSHTEPGLYVAGIIIPTLDIKRKVTCLWIRQLLTGSAGILMQAGSVTLKSVFLIINRDGKTYQSLHFLLSKQLFLLPTSLLHCDD